MNEQITGVLFKQMVLHGAAAITAQKQAINDLNVFPVPDGDTGTNMSMTIGTAVTELRKTTPTTVDQAASVTASALLRGARGNSGVILSLLFRGLSKALKGMETADAAAFAAAGHQAQCHRQCQNQSQYLFHRDLPFHTPGGVVINCCSPLSWG